MLISGVLDVSSTNLDVEYNFLNLLNLKMRGEKVGGETHGVILSNFVHDYLAIIIS